MPSLDRKEFKVQAYINIAAIHISNHESVAQTRLDVEFSEYLGSCIELPTATVYYTVITKEFRMAIFLTLTGISLMMSGTLDLLCQIKGSTMNTSYYYSHSNA